MVVSVKKSLIIIFLYYLGFLFNSFNVLYLFPLVLTIEDFGVYKIVSDAAMLFSKFDIGQSIIKFYPQFKNSQASKNLFFSFVMLVSIVFYAFLAFLFILLNNKITALFTQKAFAFIQYLPLVAFSSFLIVLNISMKFWYVVLGKTFLPNFTQNVLMKSLVSLSAVLYFYKIINFNMLLGSISFIYFTTLCILIYFLAYRGEIGLNLNFTSLNREFIKKFTSYSLYTIIGESMIMMTVKIDSLMIASMLGIKYVGIYGVVSHIGLIIEIPRRVIKQFSYPILSNAFAEKDMKKVEEAYKEISLYQFTIGFFLFILVFLNIDSIFNFIPNGKLYLKEGKWAAFFIACSRLSNMIFSISTDVLVMSYKFKYNLFIVIGLLILSVLTNYIFIPTFGLSGAAFATLLSIFFYDLINYFLIWWKFKMQFFSYRSLLIVFIGFVTALITKLAVYLGLPKVLLSFTAIVLYLGLLIMFNLFPTLTEKVKIFVKKFGKN
jgi:O-antigen/teichoic acid export membrane protein